MPDFKANSKAERWSLVIIELYECQIMVVSNFSILFLLLLFAIKCSKTAGYRELCLYGRVRVVVKELDVFGLEGIDVGTRLIKFKDRKSVV